MAKTDSKKGGSTVAVIVAIIIVILGLRALVDLQSRRGGTSAKEVIQELRQDGNFDREAPEGASDGKRKSLLPLSKDETDKLSRSDRKELDALLDDVAE
ncbi:MAG: hypothetical protein QY326_06650 [Bdellovibrionota bacterium]|nr:MAG: hypothetical protein QY326_06650 [Bdellovibrionota bacterium]